MTVSSTERRFPQNRKLKIGQMIIPPASRWPYGCIDKFELYNLTFFEYVHLGKIWILNSENDYPRENNFVHLNPYESYYD